MFGSKCTQNPVAVITHSPMSIMWQECNQMKFCTNIKCKSSATEQSQILIYIHMYTNIFVRVG